MNWKIPTWAIAVALAGSALAGMAASIADEYPSKPIRIVVPFAPSGGGDIVVRLVAQKLSERFGYSVIVDNRSGAGGNLGTAVVARAAADGYTLLMANVAPMAINVSLDKNLPYDPAKAFAPISLLASFPNVLVVHPSLPASSLPDLIALAKASPGKLTFASAGFGSTTHLAAELLKSAAGLDLVHVPYRGGGPAVAAMLAGDVSFYFSSLPAALSHIKNEQLRGLAVTSLKRWEAAPTIPAVAEFGFPGFEAVTWIGIVAPAGTPPPIVLKLNALITETMRDPEIAEKVRTLGAEPLTSTPEELAAYIRSEIKKWSQVVRDAGITTE
jgi:tripartite-type tricarboxylate transporter receptor subunit TctC